jgi:hypothetical protein
MKCQTIHIGDGLLTSTFSTQVMPSPDLAENNCPRQGELFPLEGKFFPDFGF